MAGLVRAALIRDLGAPRGCRTRVASEQNYQEGKQGGIHRPLQHLSAWQAHKSKAGRAAVAAHSLHPVPVTAEPRPTAAEHPGWGTPGCTAPALCSAFTENIGIFVFCFEWKEVRFQIIKIF